MPKRGALGGPRVLLSRLREVMAEPVSAQERLDKIVVRSPPIWWRRSARSMCCASTACLELYATEGLNREAVHLTVLRAGEGLVGLVAEEARSR